jgi:hypothetical protein
VYEVSAAGAVRRRLPQYNSPAGRSLKWHRYPNGYLFVAVRINGKPHTRLVHRLVAEAFLGPCPDGKEVNHKNGVKSDPRACNLEYVTRSENMRHAIVKGLFNPRHSANRLRGDRWQQAYSRTHARGERVGLAKLTGVAVQELRVLYATRQFRQVDLAARFGVTQTMISNIVRGVAWRHVA